MVDFVESCPSVMGVARIRRMSPNPILAGARNDEYLIENLQAKCVGDRCAAI
jgi:hypothetical protein